jgi:hypothetical protein
VQSQNKSGKDDGIDALPKISKRKPSCATMLLGENGQGNNEQKPKIGKVTEKSEPDYFGWIHARKRNLKVKS